MAASAAAMDRLDAEAVPPPTALSSGSSTFEKAVRVSIRDLRCWAWWATFLQSPPCTLGYSGDRATCGHYSRREKAAQTGDVPLVLQRRMNYVQQRCSVAMICLTRRLCCMGLFGLLVAALGGVQPVP